jgi:4-hydroxyphenylpyruvate dioxygenase
MSKVMASGNHLIKMPINEPAEGKKKSQILEYLEWHDMTPGVQHLALRTDDELHSVAELRRRGVDFLSLPDTYYEIVWERVNKTLKRAHGHEAVKEDHDRIKDLGILVDADDEGYLLQLFTKPLQDRPTLFFEIICRRGSQSFGKGNFKALFEALELEQERRGQPLKNGVAPHERHPASASSAYAVECGSEAQPRTARRSAQCIDRRSVGPIGESMSDCVHRTRIACASWG